VVHADDVQRRVDTRSVRVQHPAVLVSVRLVVLQRGGGYPAPLRLDLVQDLVAVPHEARDGAAARRRVCAVVVAPHAGRDAAAQPRGM
jgi:hypothetical protein